MLSNCCFVLSSLLLSKWRQRIFLSLCEGLKKLREHKKIYRDRWRNRRRRRKKMINFSHCSKFSDKSHQNGTQFSTDLQTILCVCVCVCDVRARSNPPSLFLINLKRFRHLLFCINNWLKFLCVFQCHLVLMAVTLSRCPKHSQSLSQPASQPASHFYRNVWECCCSLLLLSTVHILLLLLLRLRSFSSELRISRSSSGSSTMKKVIIIITARPNTRGNEKESIPHIYT